MNAKDVDMCVADTLRDDEVENLDSIVRALNSDDASSWRAARGLLFTVQEVQAAVFRLIEAGLVTACAEGPSGNDVVPLAKGQMGSVPWSDLWFHLEPAGRQAADRWWETEGKGRYPLTQ